MLHSNPSSDIGKLTEEYNLVLTSILDKHAPAKERTITLKTESPWYTEEIRIAKRERRKAERRWRSSGKLEVHKQLDRGLPPRKLATNVSSRNQSIS